MVHTEISEEELDGLMDRIRKEIAEQDRRAAAEATVPTSLAAAVREEGRPRHKLKKLLRLQDEAFVTAVFHAVLGRLPDPGEAAYHLDRLRDGRLSKVGLVEELRNTEEGRKRGAAIKGLAPHRLVSGVTRIPVLGPVLTTMASWIRMPRLANNVSRIRHQTDQLNRTIGLLQSDLVGRLEAVSAEVRRIETSITQPAPGCPFDAREELRAQLDARLEKLAAQIAGKLAAELRQRPQVLGLKLEAAIAGLSEELARFRAAVTRPGRDETSIRLDDLPRRIRELEERVASLRAEFEHELGTAARRSGETWDELE